MEKYRMQSEEEAFAKSGEGIGSLTWHQIVNSPGFQTMSARLWINYIQKKEEGLASSLL